MFGNRLGWIIAAVVAALECAGVFYALSFDAYSEPTALITPAALAAVESPTPPPSILPPVGAADATTLYRTAIDEYLAHAGDYEAMMRDSDRSRLATLTAIDKVFAARSARGDAIFAGHLEDIVAYGEPNALQAIDQLGLATYKAGVLQGKRPADRLRAIEYYQAAFVLGERLARERLTWREFDAGVILMSTAGAALVAELRRFPDRTGEADALQRFLDAYKQQRQQLLAIFEAIYSNNPEKIATHAGDVFALARDSKETMFRVEAILKLGRMRFNVGSPPLPGNQRHASRLLREFRDSPEPAIRRAAEAALALTVEEFRTLR